MVVRAFVLIEVKIGAIQTVAHILRSVQGIKSVDIITGPFDIIALIEGRNVQDVVASVVEERIRTVPGIIKTSTCISINSRPV